MSGRHDSLLHPSVVTRLDASRNCWLLQRTRWPDLAFFMHVALSAETSLRDPVPSVRSRGLLFYCDERHAELMQYVDQH